LADYWNNDTCVKLGHYNAKALQQSFSLVNVLDVSHEVVKIIKSLADT